MILTRRSALGLIPAAWLVSPAQATPTLPVPASGRLAFTVWRKGSQIGTHTAAFSRADGGLTVRTDAHFSVGLGPVSLFSYTYQVIETWRGGMLQTVAAQTNDNGTRGSCNARRQGSQLHVSGSKSGGYVAPRGSIAGTHWNSAELQAPMINPENGVLMKFTVANRGDTPPPGGTAPARQYGLTGFATLDIWYDATGTWNGLKAVAKDGSVVEYHAEA